MEDIEAARDAVIREPDEDGPRRAFAAACRRGGKEARAAYVEASLKRLRFPKEEDIPEFADGLADLAPGLRRGNFRRGFVEILPIRAEIMLANADRVFSTAPVRHLDLQDARPHLDALLAAPWWEKIRSLSLARCRLDGGDVLKIAAHPALRGLDWLDLSHNDLDIAAAEIMAEAGWPRLGTLLFHGTRVDLHEIVEHGWSFGMSAVVGHSADAARLCGKYPFRSWFVGGESDRIPYGPSDG